METWYEEIFQTSRCVLSLLHDIIDYLISRNTAFQVPFCKLESRKNGRGNWSQGNQLIQYSGVSQNGHSEKRTIPLQRTNLVERTNMML